MILKESIQQTNFNKNKTTDKKDLNDLKSIIKETPISHIIGRYLEIKKLGSNLLAICPFHEDTHPSLAVSDKINHFKCFACNTGGDAISFVEQFKKIPYVDALKEIAAIIGLDFNDFKDGKERDPKISMSLKVLRRAAQIYQKLSTSADNNNLTKETFQQFLKDRSLSQTMAEKFELGISPYGNVLTEYLNRIPSDQEKAFAIKTAEEIHLIRKSNRGSDYHFDTFHERIIFPICNGQGEIIGFTSRALKEEQKPKYLNSSDSFIFNKGQILYGLHLARPHIREKNSVIICEGNMDLIALHQHGFENSVAIMGASMSLKAIKNLKTLALNFYLALDSDKAGKKAMKNLLPVLLEEDINPKCIDFLPHKDPDDFLKAEGVIAFQKKLDEAPYLLDIVLDSLIPLETKVLDSETKINLLHQSFEALLPVKNHLLASEKLIEFGKKIQLKSDTQMLLKEFQDFVSLKAKGKSLYKTESKKNLLKLTADISPSQEINKTIPTLPSQMTVSRTELDILKMSIEYPLILEHQIFSELLDFVTQTEVKTYLGKLHELHNAKKEEASSLQSKMLDLAREQNLSMSFQQLLSSLIWTANLSGTQSDISLSLPLKKEENLIQKYFFDIKKSFKEEYFKTQRKNLIELQRNCKDEEEMKKLLMQIQEVDKGLKNLKQVKNF